MKPPFCLAYRQLFFSQFFVIYLIVSSTFSLVSWFEGCWCWDESVILVTCGGQDPWRSPPAVGRFGSACGLCLHWRSVRWPWPKECPSEWLFDWWCCSVLFSFSDTSSCSFVWFLKSLFKNILEMYKWSHWNMLIFHPLILWGRQSEEATDDLVGQ